MTPAGGSPAAAGAGSTADHLTVLFNQKVLAVRKPIAYTDLLGIVAAYLSRVGEEKISLKYV